MRNKIPKLHTNFKEFKKTNINIYEKSSNGFEFSTDVWGDDKCPKSRI